MSQVWLARCILLANPGAKPFWGNGLPRVAVRMVLAADSPAACEAAIRASVRSGGASVVAVEEILPAAQVPDPMVQAAVPQAIAGSPLMVEAPVAAPASVAVRGDELAWETVKPASDLWAIIDGVTWDGLPATLDSCAQPSACIYSTANPDTKAIAPWLVNLNRSGGMFDLLRSQPCQEHRAILLRSPLGLTALRKHLRRYTMMRMPGGDLSPKYFRFYDPRVMLDLCDAFEPERLARFFDPFDAVLVPLSPECLLPSGVFLKDPPSIFADPETCQDRLLRLRHVDPTIGDLSASYPINEREMARFGQRAAQRAYDVLARWVHDNYGDLHDPAACLSIAKEAGAGGKQFGLTSTKQVQTLAKCIALRGSEFWSRDAEALRILTQRGLLPWQRKNALQDWLLRATMPSRQAV